MVQRREALEQLLALAGEAVTETIPMVDDARQAELLEAGVQCAGIAVQQLEQIAEVEAPAAKLPDEPEGPAAPEQVEEGHDRSAAARAANPPSGSGELSRGAHVSFTF